MEFTVPAVEKVLERPHFTLEDVLEEEDCLQEVKGLNARVLKYMSDPVTLKALVTLIGGQAPADADIKRRQKYPFIACEVLTCDVKDLVSAVLGNVEYLDVLFSFLKENPADLLRATFACKVIISFIAKHATEVR